MPSVLPTGDTLPVPGGGQRLLGVWARSEEPSWETLPQHLKWLGWHTRMALLHSAGTCFGARRPWTKSNDLQRNAVTRDCFYNYQSLKHRKKQEECCVKGLWKQKTCSASLECKTQQMHAIHENTTFIFCINDKLQPDKSIILLIANLKKA